MLFDSLEELAESTMANDICLFSKFKENKRENVLQTLANLELLEKLKKSNPLRDDEISTKTEKNVP